MRQINIFIGDHTDPAYDYCFEHIQSGVDAVKKLSARESAHFIITLQSKTFFIDTPVIIDFALDKESRLTIAGTGRTVLSGGRLLPKSWSRNRDGIWQLDLQEDRDFRQLYMNDIKLSRAKYAADNFRSIDKDDEGILIPKGIADGLETNSRMQLSINVEWMHKYLNIAGIKQGEACDKIILPPYQWHCINNLPQGDRNYRDRRFWLEGSRRFIQRERDWYLDYAHRRLYLKISDDPNQQDIFALTCPTLMRVTGGCNLSIENITFKHCGFSEPNEKGFHDIQALSLLPYEGSAWKDAAYRHGMKKERVPAALEAYHSRRVTIQQCVFSHLGGNGLSIRLGGRDIAVEGNLFTDIAGSAVEVGDDNYKPAGQDQIPANIKIRLNRIEHIGNEYFGAIGILVYYCTGLEISHNRLANLPYSGISAGWGWGPDDVVPYQRDWLIAGNYITDFSRILKDSGAIYTTNPVFGDCRIEYNHIVGDKERMDSESKIHGIYHDGNSTNWVTRFNVIEHIASWIGEHSWGVQNKHDILVEHNYTSEVLEGARLAGDNIFFLNNFSVPSKKWDETAAQIIRSAGSLPGNQVVE